MRSSISNCNACFKGVPVLESLSTIATRRANGTNRLSSKLNTSNGFLRPYSYDVMIGHLLKAFGIFI